MVRQHHASLGVLRPARAIYLLHFFSFSRFIISAENSDALRLGRPAFAAPP
jgi:hypothetical protein